MEVLIYFLAMVLLDSFLYGFCYEQKIMNYNLNKGLFGIPFIFDGLFSMFEKPLRWMFYDRTTNKYRIFQKVIEIGGLLIVASLVDWNWVLLASVLLAYYLSTFEMGYYLVMNQLKLPFESNEHLQQWFNVGGFVTMTGQKFNPILFYIYATMGLIVMLLFSFNLIGL